MLNEIKSFFGGSTQEKPPESEVVLASLFVRVAKIDNEYAVIEKKFIDKLLMKRFLISNEAAQDIRKKAEILEQDTTDTVQLTKLIKSKIPFEQRKDLAVDLWSLILTDNIRSEEENSFMRLCVKLIGINDVESALARNEAKSKLNKVSDNSR
jgi:uncharacterized tellurite resistance protein B-like protein